MAKIFNPTLFSTHFGIDNSLLEQAGFIDPFIDLDTQLFIDPVLLEKSSNSIIATEAIQRFRNHFQNFVRLLNISRAQGDAAWRGASRLLDLSEPPQNGLGYGGSGRSGSSRPDEIREMILKTSKESLPWALMTPKWFL